MTKYLLIPIAWDTANFSQKPNKVLLKFTQDSILKIQRMQEISQKENVTIQMPLDKQAYYIDGDNDDENILFDEWQSDVEILKIYNKDLIVFYAQNKWDAGDQIESGLFTLETILNSDYEP